MRHRRRRIPERSEGAAKDQLEHQIGGQVTQRGKSVPLDSVRAAWFYSPVPVELDERLAPESREMALILQAAARGEA